MENKFKTILCPTKSAAIKVTNQFLRIIFLARDKLLDGSDISTLTYPSLPVNENIHVCNCNYDWPHDVEDEWDSFESVLDESIT